MTPKSFKGCLFVKKTSFTLGILLESRYSYKYKIRP
jgi:hypothetical protein